MVKLIARRRGIWHALGSASDLAGLRECRAKSRRNRHKARGSANGETDDVAFGADGQSWENPSCRAVARILNTDGSDADQFQILRRKTVTTNDPGAAVALQLTSHTAKPAIIAQFALKLGTALLMVFAGTFALVHM